MSCAGSQALRSLLYTSLPKALLGLQGDDEIAQALQARPHSFGSWGAVKVAPEVAVLRRVLRHHYPARPHPLDRRVPVGAGTPSNVALALPRKQ